MREAGYEETIPILDLGSNRVEIVVAVRRGDEKILGHPPKRPLLIATEDADIVLDRTLTDRGFAYFYFCDDAATAALVKTGLVISTRDGSATVIAFKRRRKIE